MYLHNQRCSLVPVAITMDLLVRVGQARGLDFASSSLFVEAATYLNASTELTEGTVYVFKPSDTAGHKDHNSSR